MSDVPTREEIPIIINRLAQRQKNKKTFWALNIVLEHFEKETKQIKSKERIYKIVPECKCRICGGVILQQVGPGNIITPGGNRFLGCPVCKTFQASKIMNTDVIYGLKATHEEP